VRARTLQGSVDVGMLGEGYAMWALAHSGLFCAWSSLFDAVNGRTMHADERGVDADSERARDALAMTELDERVHAYTEAGHAAITKRANRSDRAAFDAWCRARRECR
jgi:hypothetical protein